jgi:hypothetical protein
MSRHIALPLVALLLPGLAAAEDCKFSAERTATIDAGGSKRIVIAAGAGELSIAGDGGSSVRGKARACASTQELLDSLQLETRRDGDTVYLRTVMPEWQEGAFMVNRYAMLHLNVLVPKGAVLDVQDSSGELELRDVRSAVVVDSSGEQTIRNIAGDLTVTDSSGELTIEQVGGNLKLKDSSGGVNVTDVRGDVEVEVDSSGELKIRRVGGSVHVLNDSSGEIEITEVQRDVTIDVDSSGGIRVDQIGGNFTVGSDSSGGISVGRVLGTVRIPDKD